MMCIYFLLTGYYTVDYRDQFLFNAENFLSPKNVGNFHNRPKADVFLWWKAKQYNQKNRKRKKVLWLCHLFYPPYFFLFCPNMFSFFHPCKRMSSEHLWEHFTGRSHITRSSKLLFFFVSPINIKNKRTKFNRHRCLNRWSFPIKNREIFSIRIRPTCHTWYEVWFQNESKWMIQSVEYE
jgi:hypothetical protein